RRRAGGGLSAGPRFACTIRTDNRRFFSKPVTPSGSARYPRRHTAKFSRSSSERNSDWKIYYMERSAMRWTVDLNSDLGGSFGSYVIGQDEAVLERITSANIACGFHAGDHNVLRRTVKMAAEKGIGLGAHPGLPDRLGFGRRYIQVDPDDVYNMTVYQLGAVKTFAALEGKELQHVKPHGAMYNMA